MTPLCEIAFKYRTDKCPQILHSYTPHYHELFKDMRYIVKKVLEVGIGYPKTMSKVKDYVTGASLFMWRDFFPFAQIYGADVAPEAMFTAERIETFLCNEESKTDIENLISKTGSDIDIFIDDGTHYRHQQIFLCKTIMPLLKDSVIYSIEDVHSTREVMSELSEYNCTMPKMPEKRPYRSNLIIVRKK